jgi:hypothetical protein
MFAICQLNAAPLPWTCGIDFLFRIGLAEGSEAWPPGRGMHRM